jgi:hypothetical protein
MRTERGRTDATQLIAVFRDFVNKRKNDVANCVMRLEKTPSVLKSLCVAVSV